MYDIIIIGGGIAGISAAAKLSIAASVAVLEKESLFGYHASGRSAASYIPDYGNQTTRLLNQFSLNELKTLNGGVLTRRGLLMLGQKYQKGIFKSETRSYGLNFIDIMEAKRFLPIINSKKVTLASYRDDIFDLDTNQLIQNYMAICKKNNVKLLNNFTVERIEFHNNKWIVRSSSTELFSANIVNSAGAWADNVAIMAGLNPINLTPYRRSMVRVPMPSSFNTNYWPFITGPQEDWYAKPDAGQLLISPADEDPSDPCDAWPDDLVLAEGIARFEENVSIKVKRISASWAGLRTFANDKNLVIGSHNDFSTFYWFAGQGGYGFQTAPAASDLLRDLIFGYKTKYTKKTLSNLSPKRFN